ncbi:MAG TPA: cache domain-containing protein [Spirochaetota bacterium]|nr:cache domain-containing protein [Spirochaetota bacterium]
MMKEFSLRTKMLAGGCLILLVPVLVIGTITFIQTSRASEDRARKEFVQIARTLSGTIQLALQKDLTMINAIATDPLIIRSIARHDRALARKKLTELYTIIGSDYEGLGIYDQNGIIISDGVDINREGIIITDRTYFQNAKNGKAGIGHVVLSRATGAPIFVISAPIISPEGRFLGGVLAVVEIKYMVKYVSSIKIGETGYAFMLDRGGVVLAHPNSKILLTVDINRQPGLENLAEELKRNPASTAEYTYRGKRKIGGFAPIESTGWTIGVSQNRDEILSLARGTITSILLITGFFTALMLFLVFFFSEKISAPVQSTLTFLSNALEQAMEATQAGVWEAYPSTGRIHLSAQWHAMLGYEPQERDIPLEELLDMLHPENRCSVDQFFGNYIHDGSQDRHESEIRLRRADGEWCWVLSRAKAVGWDGNGAPARIIGLDINIENIKEAQVLLARSDARFRTLFRMAPLPLAEVSNDRIIEINDRFSAILGYTIEDIPTMDHWWRNAYPEPEYRNHVMTEWQSEVVEALREGTDVKFGEYRVTGRDGTVHTMIIGASTICDSMLVSLFDITERKEAEESIRKSLAEKEVLLKELYHRTKNNMQVISSLLKLKSDSLENPKLQHVTSDIRTKIQTMALVHQKLYESQDLVNINLPDFINSLSTLVLKSYYLSSEKITITQSVDDISISIDTAMPLGMVLNELISNSILHGFPEGRNGEIWIEMHSGGSDITLVYRDNGTGPLAYLEKPVNVYDIKALLDSLH